MTYLGMVAEFQQMCDLLGDLLLLRCSVPFDLWWLVRAVRVCLRLDAFALESPVEFVRDFFGVPAAVGRRDEGGAFRPQSRARE